jgi:hypothetical protein
MDGKGLGESRLASEVGDGAGGSAAGALTLVDDEVPRPSLRARLWVLLEDPSSGPLARLWSLVMLLVITASVTAFCVQSIPRYSALPEDSNTEWNALEAVFIAIFTVEYLLRLVSCPDYRRFALSVFNLIDLLSILPFYLELAFDLVSGANAALLRVVRLVRVFRIFKISKYTGAAWISIFSEAMRESAQPLLMLGVVAMIGCVFFSSAMFFAERGELRAEDLVYYRPDGTKSPFQSIPATFWWCMVTMTTVGYGDAYPITPIGKLIAVATCITGVLVLAIPITIFSTNFNVEYEKLKKQRRVNKERGELLKNHFRELGSDIDSMLLEVEKLCRLSSRDFAAELTDLVETSQSEMMIELQHLVRVAYESRQRDLKRLETQGKEARVDRREEHREPEAGATASAPPAPGARADAGAGPRVWPAPAAAAG